MTSNHQQKINQKINQNNPYGFIYKTILPDSKFYIGQHKIISMKTLDPYYFGSGVIIKDYIKSKGKAALVREIIAFGYSWNEFIFFTKSMQQFSYKHYEEKGGKRMSLTVIAEIWSALKPELEYNSVTSAADTLVDILIDSDYDPANIKEEFRRDKDVMEALDSYIAETEDEEDEEDYDDEESEDEDGNHDSGW